MAEGSPTSAPPEALEATPPEGETPTDEQPEQTVEEVEAIWKNRVSQKDRAHDAEVKALRARAEAAEARAARKAEADAEGSSEAEVWKTRYEEAQKTADQEREARLIEVREAKYPLAAEALEPAILATMDEGKLAALNARLDNEADAPAPSKGSQIDPNAAPRRSPAPPKPTEAKSVAELESDLKRYGPEFAASIEG